MVLRIPAGDVELQARLHEPEKEMRGSVVLCHPHPLYGGTMDNRVVYRAARSVAGEGFAALRFNFRGVGKSTGRYDYGLGEQEDVAAAVDWIEREYPGKPLAVLGYSFGAWVGLQVGCRDPRIRALVGIGLPLNLYNFDYLVDYPRRSLYIVGTRDEFCSLQNLEDFERRLPANSRVNRIQGADHLFLERIEEMEAAVGNFFKKLQDDQATS
jgi:alpha/beta superfamily hydrolase